VTIHVAILGIDGSGKSAIVSALPGALSSTLGVVAGSAGEDFRVTAPGEDLVSPSFQSHRLPWAARLAALAGRRAKRGGDRRGMSYYELARRILKDGAARALAARYDVDVFVSDGNALLSAAGWGGIPLREGAGDATPRPEAEDLLAVFRCILEDVPLPQESAKRLPAVERAKALQRLASWAGLDGLWLPDMLLFLDLPPEEALDRLVERGGEGDGRESAGALELAQESHRKTLEAFAACRSFDAALRLPISNSPPEDTLEVAVAWIESQLGELALDSGASPEPLGEILSTGARRRPDAALD
jgi:hypothetical protein